MPEHVIKIVLVIVRTLVRSAQLKEFLDKDFFELTFSWFRLFLKWHRCVINLNLPKKVFLHFHTAIL